MQYLCMDINTGYVTSHSFCSKHHVCAKIRNTYFKLLLSGVNIDASPVFIHLISAVSLVEHHGVTRHLGRWTHYCHPL